MSTKKKRCLVYILEDFICVDTFILQFIEQSAEDKIKTVRVQSFYSGDLGDVMTAEMLAFTVITTWNG